MLVLRGDSDVFWLSIATASFTLWAALTGEFIARRLCGGPRDPAHIAEMMLTSAAIPPLAISWRVRSAIEFRTPSF